MRTSNSWFYEVSIGVQLGLTFLPLTAALMRNAVFCCERVALGSCCPCVLLFFFRGCACSYV
jgi:hypothetical protein